MLLEHSGESARVGAWEADRGEGRVPSKRAREAARVGVRVVMRAMHQRRAVRVVPPGTSVPDLSTAQRIAPYPTALPGCA
eukprot:3080905-Rhodomonas_salina.2